MKKSIFIFTLFISIFAFLIYQNYSVKKNNLIEKRTLSSTETENYCLAIRGNGDYEPAHWGALATTIEKLGLPSAMSGGSSSTISMFLLEFMAKNEFVVQASPDKQKEIVSFLIKSLLGFTNETKESPLFKTSLDFYYLYKSSTTQDFINLSQKLLTESKWSELKLLIEKTALELPLNDQFIKLLNQALHDKDIGSALFYIKEFQESLKVFGKFDAKNDDNLFFRTGIISFEKMSHLIGKIAGFYSLNGDSNETKQKWKDILDTCSVNSIGKTWLEIIRDNPTCKNKFSDLYKSHFSTISTAGSHSISPELEEAGTQIPIFASTALLVGDEASRYTKEFINYTKSRNQKFGVDYKILNTNDVKFGYWGNPKSLLKIQNNLDPSIEKNKYFYPIGTATWKEILSNSPAEPGLSNLKPYIKNNSLLISAGGWSDLAPTLILKASGCENIVYLTRQGGESLFAQGVAKRLLKLEIPWEKIDTSSDELTAKNGVDNDAGDTSDFTSIWSNLYNMANPRSSIRLSLAAANVVLCTDWNNHDPKKDLIDSIESSYYSPFVISQLENTKLISNLKPLLDKKTSGCKY